MKKRVYFAGKIAKNGWRQEIVDLRGRMDLIHNDMEDYILEGLSIDEHFQYNGPYFIGCDHGSFHFSNSHGIGAGRKTISCCPDLTPMTRKEVFDCCKLLIDRSDVVFCYLDGSDAYGTFFEIGYAHSQNIPVYLYYDCSLKKEVINDLWFVLEGAKVKQAVTSAKEGFELFKESLYPMKTETEKRVESVPAREELITSAQANYLIGLANQTLYYFSQFYDQTFRISDPYLEDLTKKEASFCIGTLKTFLNYFDGFNRRKNVASLTTFCENMKPESFLNVFSDDMKEKLEGVQGLIPELATYSVEEIFEAQINHRLQNNPIYRFELLEEPASLPQKIQDRENSAQELLKTAVKSRNRKKIEPELFVYALNRRVLLQKIGDFVSHQVVKTASGLSTPEMLNQMNRHQLAKKFLTTPYVNDYVSSEDFSSSLFLNELAYYIDRAIPRSYAKYYLKLEYGPSRYDVDAEKFGLVYLIDCLES